MKTENEIAELLETQVISWAELQKLLVIATLKRHQGNNVRAARDLGISERTLRNRRQDYGMMIKPVPEHMAQMKKQVEALEKENDELKAILQRNMLYRSSV